MDDLLAEASDPTTPGGRLEALALDKKVAPEVRDAARRNPNLPEQVMASLLVTGDPAPWSNPTLDLFLLTHHDEGIYLGAQKCLVRLGTLPRSVAEGPVGRRLMAMAQAWWERYADVGHMLELVGMLCVGDPTVGSAAHRRAVEVALLVLDRAKIPTKGWPPSSEEAMAIVRRWLRGEGVVMPERLRAAIEASNALWEEDDGDTNLLYNMRLSVAQIAAHPAEAVVELPALFDLLVESGSLPSEEATHEAIVNALRAAFPRSPALETR